MNENFRIKFIELVKENGMNYVQVSKISGIPTATLSDCKNGISGFKLENAVKIARMFNVSVEYMVSDDKEEY
ncbi:XRE family transcriptional regulator [Staphylococcus equorum]|uniref:helix-turn-helix domain-containing protein n=1 Tax=Staphylococcus equorum TaxID=246432 RepID=UPI000D1D0154|nr:helix-turn-helix transcriptional regulator [Staphylococcus equorum]PTF10539.1 XRE family transcriptional regulator [Staphylococcus equorum]